MLINFDWCDVIRENKLADSFEVQVVLQGFFLMRSVILCQMPPDLITGKSSRVINGFSIPLKSSLSLSDFLSLWCKTQRKKHFK